MTARQKKQIAERLRSARERLEITQTTLAKKSKVGRSAIVHYENAQAIPGGMELIKLCKVLDITPNYILSGSEQFRESQEPETALLSDDMMTLFFRVVICLTSLSPEIRESVSSLLMSLVKQKMSNKDYADFMAMTDNLAQDMRKAGFDPDKLFAQMDNDIDIDKLNKHLEKKTKK